MIGETYNQEGECQLLDIEFRCNICYTSYQERQEAEFCFNACAVECALETHARKCEEIITDPREE
jgi:hypothetical protein